MVLNRIRHFPAGYKLPPIPKGYHNEKTIADLLSHYLKYDNFFLRSFLNRKVLQDAIGFVYHCSMLPEEGRYSQFKIVLQKDAAAPFVVTRFDPIEELLVGKESILRRLAPACTHSDLAILILVKQGKLFCSGVINTGSMGYSTIPCRPEFIGGSYPPRVHITVKGPGHISVELGGIAYELRGGRVQLLSDYAAVPGVKFFEEGITNYLKKRLKKNVSKIGCKMFGGIGRISELVPVILSRMIRVAVEGKRGGVFIIIPSKSAEKHGVELKYKTKKIDLGKNMIEFWRSCINEPKKSSDGAYRDWFIKKTKMLIDAEAVGGFSCIDGCVVLTRELRLCGFGGKIDIKPKRQLRRELIYRDYKTGKRVKKEKLFNELGGMRHRSAVELCQNNKNMLIFVVSQDGDYKIFWSDERAVYGFGPVHFYLRGSA